MKLIFTLSLGVLFALVGRAKTSTASGTIATSTGDGRSWDNRLPSTARPLNSGGPGSALLVVTGFTFPGLPANIIITGFTVVVNRLAKDANSVRDTRISLVKSGVPLATSNANSAFWPTASAAANYGTSIDLWGSTWLQTDLNTTFGVAIQVEHTANTTGATVNSVSVTVHYQIRAPIILTSFDVSKTAENFVNIQFATSTEENVHKIYVERSSDARNFYTIFTITPVGARNKYTTYKLVDKTPLTGMNYYRLKEIDTDGNVSHFDIKGISISRAGARFQAFYSGADIKVNLSSIKGEYVLSLHDAGGSQIRSQSLKTGSNSFQTTIPAPQRAGVYIITLRGEGFNETARIFVGQ